MFPKADGLLRGPPAPKALGTTLTGCVWGLPFPHLVCCPAPMPPPPPLLNVQRIAKTVPFTNAVYPLVLRTEWAAEMASPLLPLAVETLCKEYSFAFFPCVCGLRILFLVERTLRPWEASALEIPLWL